MTTDNLDALHSALESAGCRIRGRNVQCAFHGDKSASGSIYQGQDGRWRYKCHACEAKGDEHDITALTTGKPLVEILKANGDRTMQPRNTHREPARQEPPARVWPDLETLAESAGAVKVYRYLDRERRPLMAVLRLEPKSFRQASPCPGGWHMRKPAGRLPLFNLPSFAKTDLVVICEGEKDAVTLHGLGLVGTTAPMGADAASVSLEDDGKPGLADWQPLAGKTVVLWGDFDEPGRRHIQRIERILGRICPRPTIQRIQKIDVDDTKDAADFIKKHGDKALVMTLGAIGRAVEVRPSDALRTRIEDTIAGRHQAAPWPWSATSRLTQSLRPGAITLLAGNPGSGKSFFLLQACLEWLRDGLPIALLELEEGAGFWLSRALAVESGNSDLLDLEWMRVNGDKARDLLAVHRDHMDALAQVLTTAPAGGMSIGALADWIEEQAKTGKRIICIDPVTAAAEDPNEKPWIAAGRLMSRAKQAITASGASLVLATHGRKGTGKAGPPSLDDLAGGAAFSRFASSVVLLERLDEPEDADCIDADGRTITDTINRRLRILKAREGQGTGMVVAFDFDSKSLRFSELGTLVAKTSTAKARGVKK
jgi:hypothetical protein